MVRLHAVLGFAAVAITAMAMSSPAVSVAPSVAVSVPAGSYVPGELIVRFKPKHRSAALKAAAISRLGAAAAKEVDDSGLVRVVLDRGDDVERAVARYRGDAAVELVQPNFRYLPQRLPDSDPDPFFDRLWALKNNGQIVPQGTYPNNGGSVGNDMGMEAAWDVVTDCTGVVVAVIDTGVNYSHADLADNMWDGSYIHVHAIDGRPHSHPYHGYDFVGLGDADPMPADGDGHGTHVAGAIAATGNNGKGTTGVCWRARIMALRALDASGGTTLTVRAAVDFAIEHGARIINLSLGGSGKDDLFEAQIEWARQQGIVVVAAAGNGARDTDELINAFYPCNFEPDNVICVAALDQTYARATFTNYGSNGVDIAAPGTNIYSAWPGISTGVDLSGWQLGGGWRQVLCDFGPGLANPGQCDGRYANGADDRATKDLGATDLLGGRLTGYYRLKTLDGSPVDIAADLDSLWVGAGAGGDPFASNSITRYLPDTPDGQMARFDLSLQNCLTATCRFGFRFVSDDSGDDAGAKVFQLTLHRAQRGADVYQYADGTSMAAAHTTGVAALVWAYNPNYTYTDVVNAVKYGGDLLPSLQPYTATGRAVDAMGALRYINPPSGVTATFR